MKFTRRQVGGEPAKLNRHFQHGITVALRKIASHIRTRAKWYAPKSPTRAMLRKIYAFGSRGGGKNRPRPGRLMQSIVSKSDTKTASVFIAEDAPAIKYAAKIHDERGISWWNRGPGTVAKGPQAREKFIDRAAKDEDKRTQRTLLQEIKKATKGR